MTTTLNPTIRPTILPRELQTDALAKALAAKGLALHLIDRIIERAAVGEFDKGLSRLQAERESCRHFNVEFPFHGQADPAFSPA